MKKILIVDDNREAREMIAEILADQGYTVSTAEDGFAAMDCLAKEIPDLIVLDVMMPGMDGIQFAKKVREKQETKHIPILFSTIFKNVESSLMKDADTKKQDFIEKPYKPDALINKIKSLLNE